MLNPIFSGSYTYARLFQGNSAEGQGTEGKSTDVVCYCIEFPALVLCLCKTLGAISSDIGTFLITSVWYPASQTNGSQSQASQGIIMVTLVGQTTAASQYNVVGQELLHSQDRETGQTHTNRLQQHYAMGIKSRAACEISNANRIKGSNKEPIK